GPSGGVVCPRCELPFSRSILSPNLVTGKLVRCPHCGKVSILARASRPQLEQAESKYLNEDTAGATPLDDQGYQKLLEESRYED
ncbi:MAG: zinc-ribbon domain-containing protein, partial [Anaerolineales bacterium]|nr:zinc-ribbon domain-containing protein [Anaerolineales bacterium]